MDITPQDNTLQSISDDQELAKALAGVLPDTEEPKGDALPGMQFEETPTIVPTLAPVAEPITIPDPIVEEPVAPTVAPAVAPSAVSGVGPLPSTGSADLDEIKLAALKELQPLMGKVDLPAEEKFDTYLMLIRSTDDKSLIAPAHAAAQNIGDEKRKAEALLEIIKEIDYLSRKEQPAA